MGEQPWDRNGHQLGQPLATKLTSQTEGSSSWWLPNKLSNSWSCPETVAKAGPTCRFCDLGCDFWWEQSVCVVKNGLYQLCNWFTRPAGFFLEQCGAWGIYTSLLSLCSPQSSGLVSNKGPTSHQQEGSNAASCRLFPLGVCMKHLHKSRDPAIPPGQSSCTLQVSWSSVDDAWENICERAEGLRGAVLLSLKGQQQELCWNFTQNLHRSQERLNQPERGETQVFEKIGKFSEAVLGKLKSPKKQELTRGSGFLAHVKHAAKRQGTVCFPDPGHIGQLTGLSWEEGDSV